MQTATQVKDLIFSNLTQMMVSGSKIDGLTSPVNSDQIVLTARDEDGNTKSFSIKVEECPNPEPYAPAQQAEEESGGCKRQRCGSSQKSDDTCSQEAAAQDDAKPQESCKGDVGCSSQDG